MEPFILRVLHNNPQLRTHEASSRDLLVYVPQKHAEDFIWSGASYTLNKKREGTGHESGSDQEGHHGVGVHHTGCG